MKERVEKTQNQSTRIAFVGAGNHSVGSLYPNVAHIPESNLVAACDIDEDRAKRAARKSGALRVYTDEDEMLSETELQSVRICSPPNMHYIISIPWCTGPY